MTSALSRAARRYSESYFPGMGNTTPPVPDPSITSLAPNTGVVGVEVTVLVNGTEFSAASVVEINQIPAPGGTTFVSATQLSITETPQNVGTAVITVRNGGSGGQESNSVPFEVTAVTGDLVSSWTVERVKEYVVANPSQLSEVFERETHGRNRPTLVAWLQALLDEE